MADWYKLVYAWCYLRKPKGYGLTIPFVVGALEGLTLESLLTDMKDSAAEEKIILQYCNDREEYIFSMDDPMYPMSDKLHGFGNLLINDKTIEALLTFDKLVEFLDNKYSPVISDATFSKNMETNEWESYAPADLEFINKSLRG